MENMRYEVDGDGIALITWDMPGRSMNVLSPGSIADYAACVEKALADPAVKGVVVTSAKPAFIAGADLDGLEKTSAGSGAQSYEARAKQIYDWVWSMQTLFRKVEKGG